MRKGLFGLLCVFLLGFDAAAEASALSDLKIICEESLGWPPTMGGRREACLVTTEAEAKALVDEYAQIATPGDIRYVDLPSFSAEREAARRKARAKQKAKIEREKQLKHETDFPSAEKVKGMHVADLCWTYRRAQSPDVFSELVRRAAFPPKDLALIKHQKIAIGMHENAMLCSIGAPDNKNRTVTASRVSVQWIYAGLYVYTENGYVTSWQD